MSYHPTRAGLPVRYRKRAALRSARFNTRRALGDQITDCESAATAYTAEGDAYADSLQQNWNPTGYYTPDEVRSVLAQVNTMNSAAWNYLTNITQIGSVLDTQATNVRQAIDDVTAVGQQVVSYLADCSAADATGQPMYIPDFKHWVLHALDQASSASQAAYIAWCVTPSLPDIVAMAFSAWASAIYGAATKVGALVIKAGQAALHVGSKFFDLADAVATYLPWIAAGVAVVWLFSKSKSWSKPAEHML